MWLRMKKRIAVIPGDGIGPEVIREAVKVMESAGAPVECQWLDWGADKYLREGIAVPPDGFRMLSENYDSILVGAFGDPRVPDNRHAANILLGMRFQLDLYANVRPARLLDRRLCPLRDTTEKDVRFIVQPRHLVR